MITHNGKPITSIVFGGIAGDGTREAGLGLGQILRNRGRQVFVELDYPSLIRGGHNVARVNFSEERLGSGYRQIDVLVALNQETIDLHREELVQGAIVIAEKFTEADAAAFGVNAVALPLAAWVKEASAPAIARTSPAMGAIAYLLNIPHAAVEEVFRVTLGQKSGDLNVALAERGWKHMEDANFRRLDDLSGGSADAACEFTDGNLAFSKGLAAAGMDFYISYPMTPASSILHHLAAHKAPGSYKVIQPESELAALNMALGAAYAGKRVATGTSGGGFALMQEAFSLAGIAEIPVVVALSQRPGPATGVPTYTAQGELHFARHAGHGEFPRIVVAPGDPEEAFRLGAQAMNLAWKYQMPVIVLLDKQLSESSQTAVLDGAGIVVERGKVDPAPDATYQRYRFTPDGVSPMAFPGTPNVAVKVNSYEHSEDGITTEDAHEVKAMQDKRFEKTAELEMEFAKGGTVNVYGDPAADAVVVFWGSTKGAVLEAAKHLTVKAKFLQVVWMEPFDARAVLEHLKDARVIVDVELNRNGQLAQLIREKTGIDITRRILHYNGRPFEPLALAKRLEETLH